MKKITLNVRVGRLKIRVWIHPVSLLVIIALIIALVVIF